MTSMSGGESPRMRSNVYTAFDPATRAANPRIRRASRNVSTTQASLVRDMAEKKQDSEPDSKGNCAS